MRDVCPKTGDELYMDQRPRHRAVKVIREALLRADSPKEAFYRIRVEVLPARIGYVLRKESGSGKHVSHREAWFRDSLKEAINFYEAKIKQKTTPGRKRVYSVEVKWKAPSPARIRPSSTAGNPVPAQPELFDCLLDG